MTSQEGFLCLIYKRNPKKNNKTDVALVNKLLNHRRITNVKEFITNAHKLTVSRTKTSSICKLITIVRALSQTGRKCVKFVIITLYNIKYNCLGSSQFSPKMFEVIEINSESIAKTVQKHSICFVCPKLKKLCYFATTL